MYEYFCKKTWILFFISLRLKQGVFSTQQKCSENDITKYLNESINNILAIDAEKANELFYTVEHHNLTEFEYDISKKVDKFQTKFFFQNISMEAWLRWNPDYADRRQIHWEFLENKMNVFYKNFQLVIRGFVGTVKGKRASKIEAYPNFEHFTLSAVRSHIEDNDLQFTYNTTYSNFTNIMRFYPDANWYSKIIPPSDEKPITEAFLLAMVHENIHNNQNFTHSLEKIFQVYEKPRREIISKYPNFLNRPHQYYYLTPENPLSRFALKDIVIGGLSNFESFGLIHKTSGIFTHTLLIRDVQGKMTLDYRSEKASDLELNFQIDCLFISKKNDSGCVFVQAKYYTVTRTKSNVSLNDRQSEVIINGLESAIASSLLPSMKVGQTCDLKTPLEKIEIPHVSDWNTIKESYKLWIPFDEDEVV